MGFTKKDHVAKRAYQTTFLGGLIAAPFTGGLSLIVSAGSLIASKKYNSVLQTGEEGLDERIYYTKRDIVKEYNCAKKEELDLHYKLKSIEGKVKDGGIEII